MRGPALVLFGVLAAPLGCGSGSEVDAMADATCDCLRPVAEAAQQVQAAAAAGRVDSARARFQTVMQQADACVEGLESSFGASYDASEGEIRRGLRDRCPEVAAFVVDVGLGD